jgi:hypothetical protein
MKAVVSAFAVFALFTSVAFANGPEGSEIDVGVGNIFQNQISGNDNVQDAAIGFVDSSVDNAKVTVKSGYVTQMQSGGFKNIQHANVGVICDCTPDGHSK